MDYELLLFDRVNMIRDTITRHGEENFYLSFSGGKDSTILHYLIDIALPDNNIPRVFINTGIEYSDIVSFVKELAEQDKRIVIISPKVSIKQMLDKYGYPFKSKEHSCKIGLYKNGSRSISVMNYKNRAYQDNSKYQCPKKLLYQYRDEHNLKISDQCCYKLKKEPVKKWAKQNNKTITITGMRKEEGGQRENMIGCIITKKSKVVKFHPLLVVDEEFENKFIEDNNIKLCRLYYEPFNFKRTGCKGCPFALELQNQLEVMARLLPAERQQCESIWKPVYKEYRDNDYRLKKIEQIKML